MNIGLYNRWLSTLGGGERLSMAIAAHLAQSHTVDVLSHSPVDPHTIADRLDLDLHDVNFRIVPMDGLLTPNLFTSHYDLFINASNGDYIRPPAPRNAMLVYFPASPPTSVGQRLRRYVAQQVDGLAAQPRFVSGVYGPSDIHGVIARGLAQYSQIILPTSSLQSYRVHFSLIAGDPTVSSAIVYLDSQQVAQISFRTSQDIQPIAITVPRGASGVMMIVAEGTARECAVPLYMTALTVASRRAKAYDRVFTDAWPELGTRQQNPMPTGIPDIVGEYDVLWAISRYTQRWIRAYWNLPSTLLYPPVPVDSFPPLSKRPIILSIGRFFAGNHNKKHLVMIDAFRRMLHDGLKNWELHLVGSLTSGEQHRRYLEHVRVEASGAPIHIHTDMPNDELAALLGTSSIYWHAAGYGEDPTKDPGKFEHFGISVVEAMAAGNVPVVVGQGGLTELVRHSVDGFLWYDEAELRSNTTTLIDDSRLRSKMAQQAIISSRRFDVGNFHGELDDSLSSLVR